MMRAFFALLRSALVVVIAGLGLVFLASCSRAGDSGNAGSASATPLPLLPTPTISDAGAPAVVATAVVTPALRSTSVPSTARTPLAEGVRLGQTLRDGQVHALPAADSPVLGPIDAARLVVVTGAAGDWYEIVYGEGRGGHAWIERALVSFERVSPTPSPTNQPSSATVVATPPPQTSPIAQPAPLISRAVLPGKLVFQEHSGGAIYVINADGTELRRVASGLDPAFAPDGKQIAYSRWDEPRGLFVMSLDGLQAQQLVGENLIKSPTWSPDGRAIAFSQQRGGSEAQTIVVPGFGEFVIPADPYWRLSAIDLSNGQRSNLADDNHSFTPSWGAQGILFADGRGLQRTRPDGAPQRLLTSPNAVRNPRESPDGTSIVATMEFHDHWEIVKLNADGSGLQRLTPERGRSNSVAPVWSPDGRSIGFLSDRSGRWELWVMNADGSSPRRLLPEALAGIEFHYDFAAEQVLDWGR